MAIMKVYQSVCREVLMKYYGNNDVDLEFD